MKEANDKLQDKINLLKQGQPVGWDFAKQRDSQDITGFGGVSIIQPPEHQLMAHNELSKLGITAAIDMESNIGGLTGMDHLLSTSQIPAQRLSDENKLEPDINQIK